MYVEVVSILTAIQIRSVTAGYLLMNFITFVMKRGNAFCSRRSDSVFHNESSDFSNQEKYVYMTICVYGKTLEKLLRTRCLCDTAVFLLHFAVKGN